MSWKVQLKHGLILLLLFVFCLIFPQVDAVGFTAPCSEMESIIGVCTGNRTGRTATATFPKSPTFPTMGDQARETGARCMAGSVLVWELSSCTKHSSWKLIWKEFSCNSDSLFYEIVFTILISQVVLKATVILVSFGDAGTNIQDTTEKKMKWKMAKAILKMQWSHPSFSHQHCCAQAGEYFMCWNSGD